MGQGESAGPGRGSIAPGTRPRGRGGAELSSRRGCRFPLPPSPGLRAECERAGRGREEWERKPRERTGSHCFLLKRK